MSNIRTLKDLVKVQWTETELVELFTKILKDQLPRFMEFEILKFHTQLLKEENELLKKLLGK